MREAIVTLPATEQSKPRVLVVEDDLSVARMLRVCLSHAGYGVVEAGTGGEALAWLRSELPDAVVLDLGLPDGLGGAVLACLREGMDEAIPWIAVTALSWEDVREFFGDLEGHLLMKPFDPWVLIDRIQGLMAGDHE